MITRQPDLEAVLADYIGSLSAAEASAVLSDVVARHPEWRALHITFPRRGPEPRLWSELAPLRFEEGGWGSMVHQGGTMASVPAAWSLAPGGVVLRTGLVGKYTYRAYPSANVFLHAGPLPMPVGGRTFAFPLAAERALATARDIAAEHALAARE